MERPRFLTGKDVGQALAVVGFFLNIACISAVNTTEAKPISQPPVPTTTPARFWEGSRLPLSEGQFTTNKGRTYWSNFTTTPFDPKAAERMLATFEYFAQRRSLAIQISDPQDSQRNEVVSIQTWPEPPTDLVLNLIPDNAPLPE